jgi:hypothetical protein
MKAGFVGWPGVFAPISARRSSKIKILTPLLIILFSLFSTGCGASLSDAPIETSQATSVEPTSAPLPDPATATFVPAPPVNSPTLTPIPVPPLTPTNPIPTPAPPVENQPAPGAGQYNYGEAPVDQIEIVLLESLPVQVNVVVRGSLPDSCTTLDQVLLERTGNTFQGLLTTRWPGDRMCAQALVPYEKVIPLDITGLPPGQYTVTINGVSNTFTLPATNPSPEITPPATTEPLPTPQPTTQTGGISRVQIFLVAIGDNGQSGQKIGCDDSLVPVERDITPTIAPLRAAINELLSLREQYYGQSGLYNALYQANLQAGDIVIDPTGKATIHLAGNYTLGGVCDMPRFQAQLEAIALQFSTVNQVAIFLNGQPIEEALSLAGGAKQNFPQN